MIQIVTPWYADAAPFFDELAESVAAQTRVCKWSIYVSRRDIGCATDLARNYSDLVRVEEYPVELVGAIAQREWLYNRLLRKERGLVVHVDADDVLGGDRVQHVIDAWEKDNDSALYLSQLRYLNDQQSNVMNLPQTIKSPFDLSLSNCVGLSHVAFNVSVLNKLFPEGFKFINDIIALDWFIAVDALARGGRIISDKGIVYYRVYEGNVAGDPSLKSDNRRNRVQQVKSAHYAALESVGLANCTPGVAPESGLEEKMSDFAKRNWRNWWWGSC